LTKSAKLVEDEQWGMIEVSPRSQRVADLLVEMAVSDPSEVRLAGIGQNRVSVQAKENGTTINSSLSTPDLEKSPKVNGASSEESQLVNAKFLVVDNRSFYVVSATMQVLGMVVEYLTLMVNLPSLDMECMSRLVEFLKVSFLPYIFLKLLNNIGQAFNSRTCQVVLGAGAMRSAGLRNITARHLGEYSLEGCGEHSN
jgi:vacuolar protein sorting-associated protein 54